MSRIDIRAVQGAVVRRGVQYCVGLPAVLLITAVLLRERFDFLAQAAFEPHVLKVIGFVAIALAGVDLAVVLLIKQRRLNPVMLKSTLHVPVDRIGPQLAEACVPLFVIAAVPAVIGVIFYFLGGDLDTYVLISVFCPAGLLLLKPREEELERLERELFGETDHAN